MDTIIAPGLSDRAIAGAREDALDRGPFVTSLVRALVKTNIDAAGNIRRSSTGFVVGLTGPWGSGKSSVLKLLEDQLGTMDQVVVAHFNPWLFKGRDELLTGFFSALRDALGLSRADDASDVLASVQKYWRAVDIAAHGLAIYADLHGGAGIVTRTWSRANNTVKGWFAPAVSTPEAERRSLEEKIKQKKIAIVVLIDELDRVEDDEVRAVAQLVKAVGDIRGMSYLVAYDPVRVADALGRGTDPAARRAIGEAYLEKIIQYAIPLRPLFIEDSDALLSAAFTKAGLELAAVRAESESAIYDHLRSAIHTPRDVKRLVGIFSVLYAAVSGEVSPYDVLGYAWIVGKSPALRELIEREFDKLVDDPGEGEMIARLSANRGNNKSSDPVEVLGDLAADQSKLLRLLFPRFGGSRREPQGNRINQRRNFVRLLYLGNPPTMVSRKDVEELWLTVDRDVLRAKLGEAYRSGKLRDIVQRLDDLLLHLSVDGDLTFWPALAVTLVRDHDWLEGPEDRRAIADDAMAALLRFGMENHSNAERTKRIVQRLISDGDLIIVPAILRKHMFAHGVSRNRQQVTDRVIYSKEETIQLRSSELPRYENALREGTLLRRIPNLEALYVISNTEMLDDDLKAEMTAQLQTSQAVCTLAGLIVPPGYSTDKSYLGELFNIESVQRVIRNELSGENDPTNPWLSQSVRRLSNIMRGYDADFGPDDEEEVGTAEAAMLPATETTDVYTRDSTLDPDTAAVSRE